MVVADLHIGWEVALAKKGIYIPSQTSKQLKSLTRLIRENRPKQLVFLGDVKQSVAKISMDEWKDIPVFFESLGEVVNKISVTAGNHDGDLEPLTPRFVDIYPPSGLVLDMEKRVGLFHGHAWPSPEVLSCEIMVMGHIHPAINLQDNLGIRNLRQVWLRAKLDGEGLARAYLAQRKAKAGDDPRQLFFERFSLRVDEPQLIVMPSFNGLIGGLSVNHLNRRLMGVLLRSESIRSENFEVYLLDGTFLGSIGSLSNSIASSTQQ